ncbi:MAG: TRAP transporter fused permease subunit [Gracilibacteraceae bacterium]|jgi:TRAP transporter 4TM/12TM fusion protein|nr:TRAP transporter fused permease subunit [Gracilibacteraceae bacterium]
MRELSKNWKLIIGIASVALVLFQFYVTATGLLSDLIQRPIHLAFVLGMCFILKPINKKSADNKKVPAYDIALSLLSIIACLYIVFHNKDLLLRPLQWFSYFDKAWAILLFILILEASRRAIGWIFPIMGAVLLIYAKYGIYFPPGWRHKGFSFDYLFQFLYHMSNGFWGSMVGLAATLLAMFGIFAAMLSITGGADTFIKLGLMATGRMVGGPGKVAVVASCLFGMVSGSAMGNVVAVGTFTIPLMKKAGFKSVWAGAVEAVVSTGGQIMPPIMASSAFIMASLLGISYLSIAKAAIVPALLYFGSVFICVHYYAKRHGIMGIDAKEKINVRELLVILLPLTMFMFFVFRGYSVMYSAYYATLLGIATYIAVFLSAEKNPKAIAVKTGGMLYNLSNNGAKNIVDMTVLMTGAQISISLINTTGIGIKISDWIVGLGQSSLFLCLFFSMIVCIILGMGLPTAAVYVIAAAILVPPLSSLGVNTFVAHMFMIYFSALATITPPVCSAVYMASAISGANWVKTGFTAVGIALPAFVVPFFFVQNEALLLRSTPVENLIAVVTAVVGVYFIGVGMVGFFDRLIKMPLRFCSVAGGLLLLYPSWYISLFGVLIGVMSLILNRFLQKKPNFASPS